MKEDQTAEQFIHSLTYTKDIELPEDCGASFLLRDLFSKLCKANPTERYNAKDVLMHPAITGKTKDPIPLTENEQITLFTEA